MRVSENMNALRYVYASWVVIDANNQFVPGTEALLLGELDVLYKFLHTESVAMTPGLDPEDILLAFADDKIDGEKIREYFPNCTVMLDTFHFLVGERGVCILSRDFGDAWKLVKDHFRGAVYAKKEEECLVRSVCCEFDQASGTVDYANTKFVFSPGPHRTGLDRRGK